MKKIIEGTEFLCPKCGGREFGTVNPTDPETAWIRECQEDDSGCGFEWPIADDWKYFGLETRHEFESREEFEAVVA